MSSNGSASTDEDPETAFALIGNEIRAEILRALGQDPYDEVSFYPP